MASIPSVEVGVEYQDAREIWNEAIEAAWRIASTSDHNTRGWLCGMLDNILGLKKSFAKGGYTTGSSASKPDETKSPGESLRQRVDDLEAVAVEIFREISVPDHSGFPRPRVPAIPYILDEIRKLTGAKPGSPIVDETKPLRSEIASLKFKLSALEKQLECEREIRKVASHLSRPGPLSQNPVTRLDINLTGGLAFPHEIVIEFQNGDRIEAKKIEDITVTQGSAKECAHEWVRYWRTGDTLEQYYCFNCHADRTIPAAESGDLTEAELDAYEAHMRKYFEAPNAPLRLISEVRRRRAKDIVCMHGDLNPELKPVVPCDYSNVTYSKGCPPKPALFIRKDGTRFERDSAEFTKHRITHFIRKNPAEYKYQCYGRMFRRIAPGVYLEDQ